MPTLDKCSRTSLLGAVCRGIRLADEGRAISLPQLRYDLARKSTTTPRVRVPHRNIVLIPAYHLVSAGTMDEKMNPPPKPQSAYTHTLPDDFAPKAKEATSHVVRRRARVVQSSAMSIQKRHPHHNTWTLEGLVLWAISFFLQLSIVKQSVGLERVETSTRPRQTLIDRKLLETRDFERACVSVAVEDTGNLAIAVIEVSTAY